MKKTLKFLQSMRFGMILLVLILICSLVGSFVVQGEQAAYYRDRYGSLGDVLLALKLDNVFFSWYFLTLLLLLCLNLLFCSVLRLGKTGKSYRAMPEATASATAKPLDASRDELTAFLSANRFRRTKTASGEVYARNRAGHYGTFVVHLALLLLFISAAGAIYFSSTEDISLREGEQLTLHDGTVMTLDSFRSANEAGEVVYESDVSAAHPDGTVEQKTITVNFPANIAGQKIFQMGYGAEGRVTIDNQGAKDILSLTSQEVGSFLTLDGKTGLVFRGLYPDYVEDENGISLRTSSKLGFPNPVYAVTKLEDGHAENGVAVPGTTLVVGQVSYTFEKPMNISTLRLKSYPPGIFALLYLSFVLLIGGIWLAFFQVPAYVRAEDNGYVLRSAKPVPELEKAIEKIPHKRKT